MTAQRLQRNGWLWVDDDGQTHLSECLLVEHPEMHCTCRDDSPDWTL